MKLQYKILWFEDQFGEVEGDIERLKALVREYGFLPEIIRKNKISEDEIDLLSDKLYTYNPYDLVIFDYDLGTGSANGLSIATKLRATIYTDMVFYSGKVPDDLRKLLFDDKVDGVFIVHRPTLYDDIEPIIEDHIKRMSDINNMRGVVMSATSSIDILLRKSLLEKINGLGDDETKEVFDELKKRLNKKIIEQQGKVEKQDNIVDMVNNHFLTNFNIIKITLKSLYSDDSEPHYLLSDNQIIHNVQKERNNLAHQEDEYTDDGKLILHGKKEPVEYDFDEFKRIRNELLEAMENIAKKFN